MLASSMTAGWLTWALESQTEWKTEYSCFSKFMEQNSLEDGNQYKSAHNELRSN